MDDAQTGAETPSFSDEELAFIESIFEMARSGQTEELARVLDAGVPANLTNAKGDSLLILAAYHQHDEAVEALLARGADVDRVNDMGQTAMACAVFRNNAPIVRRLLASGADPDLGSHTALEIARQFGIVEMQSLLESEASAGGPGRQTP
ncbi:ankyrin repeat domain-containing protein [Salinibacterium sp. SYSU T00001]|uniref:ankyrin repeat domain-containing protein n=1 Tax=Homoserinimonas sedimenticola TaxID=2986805 RepID=UPI00223681E3|nr:ankyrin repeat domain-containing protein [Salinibacterium sedimenticola]MCW4384790.1 ankyrin repeat domain-containing protein [Salinibacterium sedimenticola]